MNAKQLLRAFDKAGRRVHLVGDFAAGVIAALDVEGRLFVLLDGEVLNRVNPKAIDSLNARGPYVHPGGDGLWPAPEGTALGYQYSTGTWRVPPGLRAARYVVTRATQRHATITAEVDLVNNQGRGIPTVFRRRITVVPGRRSVCVNVVESIVYIGHKPLRRSECLLAPWSLCQFDCGPDCEVVFPCERKSSVRDLYEPSDRQREWKRGRCHSRSDGSQRYQIGIDAKTPWIEFRDPAGGLIVRRKAGPLPIGQSYIDIRDAAPNMRPFRRGIRYSVYSDTNHCMEIEAAGGCPAIIRPNTEMCVRVSTRFART